ncbi:MAG: hypothetical protein J2P23_03385 [Microlunatus sp.]|nr:hypothetical protein [Microlunatus sp.]
MVDYSGDYSGLTGRESIELLQTAQAAAIERLEGWKLIPVTGDQGHMSEKVLQSLMTYETENRRMRADLRQAYDEGSWTAASASERWNTKRAFGINLAKRRELRGWLAKHDLKGGTT